ncbi:MAG TPA: 2-amino-4-hydroxy-6-hydroxymethyldihydropteridine diphosphokinase [Woeseiaceae bacterium]
MPPGRWRPAYVGIGSNLADPAAQVLRARTALEALPESGWFAHSGLWRSEPVGPGNQPDYVNACSGFVTRLGPHELLGRLKRLEREAGRTPGERWGPRILDLDLLVLGAFVLDDAGLTLPHPRAAERNFVLLPLAEIAPYLTVPGRGSVARLLGAVSRTNPGIERIGAGRE